MACRDVAYLGQPVLGNVSPRGTITKPLRMLILIGRGPIIAHWVAMPIQVLTSALDQLVTRLTALGMAVIVLTGSPEVFYVDGPGETRQRSSASRALAPSDR
jgi:hypothetical protein